MAVAVNTTLSNCNWRLTERIEARLVTRLSLTEELFDDTPDSGLSGDVDLKNDRLDRLVDSFGHVRRYETQR